MNRDELHAAILKDVQDRDTWDTRQELFYRMRHHGLRRKSKPYPMASDVHFPLADMAIEKLKPYYFQQLFATELVAKFVPVVNQVSEFTTAAEQWFDYQLKQKSNLEEEILRAIDHMLVTGISVVKITWDKRLKYQAIDPQHVIVPSWTKCVDSADRIVHVQRYSEEAFMRLDSKVWKNSKDVVESLRANYGDEAGDEEKAQVKFEREGLTWAGEEQGHIIVWEVWTKKKGKWVCETFSPTRPELDLRPTYSLKDGGHPFAYFAYEVKDKGWYSSRGVVEQVAVFEAEATKLLNEKNDAMTFYNRPLFQNTTGQNSNTMNMTFKPGSILPQGVQPVQMPQPPISFDVHMNLNRELAQQRVATPDFGISSVVDTQDRRTATEIQAISGLHQQSSDLRMRVFRMALAKLYRKSWKLLLENQKQDLTFWFVDAVQEVPENALHEKYGITPSGSADGVNKPLLVQKAFQRFQLFAGNPLVDQFELVKSVLEVDDATLVKRLARDPQIRQADQAEEQASEIAIMKTGYPAQVKPSDDHALHIQTVMSYVTNAANADLEIGPQEQQLLTVHTQQHLEALRQQDPEMAKAAEDAIGIMGEQLSTNAQAQVDPNNPEMVGAQAQAAANPMAGSPGMVG